MRLLVSLLLSVGFQAQALPTVQVENINGFEVHFVDIGVGNSIGVSFQVPYGTLHDHGRFMGRAHLLEHLMHVGTLKYPGHNTFDEVLLPAGIDSNAGTYYGRTFYYAAAKDDQAELILKVYMSMLSGLEMGPKAVEHERNVVINEIVDEGIPQQSTAFAQMPFMQLLPPSHPWSISMLGDRPSLKGLTKDDLQNLYNQVYRPGVLKIAIHGNFSKPDLLNNVRGWVKEYVKASPKQNGKPYAELMKEKRDFNEANLATRRIQSLFSATNMAPESQKRLYIHSQDFNMGLIILEADRSKFPKNSQAMEMFARYMDSKLPGGYIHKLRTQLGWITDGGIMTMDIRGRQLMYFSYTMTEAGKSRGREINEMFFNALKEAQDIDVSPAFLARMKRIMRHEAERASRSAGDFMDYYGPMMKEGKPFDEQIMDIRTLQLRDIRSVALLFRPDQALYEFAGPQKSEMETDPVYGRKFKLEDNRADLERYMEIMRPKREWTERMFNPRVEPVDLGEKPAAARKVFLQSKLKPGLAERFTVDLRYDLPDAAVTMDFVMRPGAPSEMVAVELVMDAFNERYAGELAYLDSQYHIKIKTQRTARNLTLTAEGEDSYAARGLTWALGKLSEFIPTREEMIRARERVTKKLVADYVDAFSAQVVVQKSRSLVDPYALAGMPVHDAALKLTFEEMSAAWDRLRARANRNLTAVGAFDLSDLESVRRAGFKFVAKGLSDADVQRMGERFTWDNSARTEAEENFPKSKGDEAYAIARLYRGPRVRDVKENAAFQALQALLSNQVYIHNRSKQQLGYMHNVAARAFDEENLYMIIFGGTNGEENAGKTIAGWNYIFDRIKTGEIADEEIADAISSVANGLGRLKTSARELAEEYSAALNLHGDGRAARVQLEAVRSLTPEDVRESARKYLLADGTPYTQLTLHGCEDLLLP